ncbi:MAG: hypothetical protein SFY92_11035 [Verrucomicrobiae bacterium]|nr:hypothetical protein [Verrucomicrobiae bacterium]
MNLRQSLSRERLKQMPITGLLTDLVSWVREPRQEWDVWRAFATMRREAAFLRSGNFPPPDRGRLLIANLSNSICWAQMHSLLAIGLRMEGWTVSVLTSRLHPWANRVFTAHGITDFVYWEDILITDDEITTCEREAAGFMKRDLTFREVKNWQFEGCRLGPQILSTVCRGVRQGAPDIGDPDIRNRIGATLPLGLSTVFRTRRLLDRVQPDLITLVEANYAVFGIIVDVAVARGLNVVQAVQPSRDDAIILKRLTPESRRFHPSSLTPETMALVRNLAWTESHERELHQEFSDRYSGKWFLQARNQPGCLRHSKDEILRDLSLDPSKKTAVLFSHVLWDANLFYGEDLFEDYGDWFIQSIRAACANPRLNWLIKLHPANVWKRSFENASEELAEITLIRKHIGDLPPHVRLLLPDTRISSYSLFETADFGITVRGTTGIELPCMGVRTLTAGTGRYSGLGFTTDFRTREDYLSCLSRLDTLPAMDHDEILLAKKHAYFLFRRRPWLIRSFHSLFHPSQKLHPLYQYFSLNVSSLEEIRQNDDLKKWAVWAGNPLETDYLEPESPRRDLSPTTH